MRLGDGEGCGTVVNVTVTGAIWANGDVGVVALTVTISAASSVSVTETLPCSSVVTEVWDN